MVEQLASGWWRCGCVVPCNCNDKSKDTQKINPPGITFCAGCGTNVSNAQTESRAEQREKIRRSVKDKRG